VAVEIYSVAGKLVARADAEVEGTRGSALWDGTAADGRPAASGVYFARLKGCAPTDQAKIVLVR
jgi:hypothetical protein